MIGNILFACLFILSVVFGKSLPDNNPSGYAKVSSFGVNKSAPNEARSSGLSLYSQSSNAKVIGGQNLRSKVAYFRPTSSRVGEDSSEELPAKGEVQERYNPRPYFQYVQSGSTDQNADSKPSVVYGTPFKPDSNPPSPIYNAPPSDADSNPPSFDSGPPKQPSNLYDSPYDSYNPPTPSKPDDSDSQKPSSGLYDSPYDSYNPKPDSQSDSIPMKPSNEVKNEYPGFPYAPQELDHPPKDSDMYLAPQKPMEADYKPKEVDSYMPQNEKPDMEVEKPSDHDYKDFSGYRDQAPQIVATVKPPESVRGHYHDYPPPSYDHHHAHIVDSPPTSFSYGKVPEYIEHEPKEHHYHYPDFVHVEHPVYHEVTTTTEMPEERVNKGQYSYYYLGRKLWYIPLYFSAYFILYITVLILKSIARHKVNFIHDLHNLGKARSGRDMKVNELAGNVTSAISKAEQKYM